QFLDVKKDFIAYKKYVYKGVIFIDYGNRVNDKKRYFSELVDSIFLNINTDIE
ncbi:TPA: capsular biosynthesis protein, partial [Klebsiella pneumoniae]|nr:capsular biosynthesis protein [Klebsiella pneumoniae]